MFYLILYFILASGSEILGHIGRKVSADDEEVTFDVHTAYDEASGGFKLTVSWDGPSDRVFEDCFDFGEFIPVRKACP